MLLHLKQNVRRTITHAIEVEEKIPLEQVNRKYVILWNSCILSHHFWFPRWPTLTSSALRLSLSWAVWHLLQLDWKCRWSTILTLGPCTLTLSLLIDYRLTLFSLSVHISWFCKLLDLTLRLLDLTLCLPLVLASCCSRWSYLCCLWLQQARSFLPEGYDLGVEGRLLWAPAHSRVSVHSYLILSYFHF